jgi:probable phosphoglycerate mutase
MSDPLPFTYLARHGETAWTISRQHTGTTDLPLTAQGEREALGLGKRLEGLAFAAVLTSPLQRAVRTCELAGFGSMAKVEPDLIEWNYGAYEGRTSADIHRERPDWQLFRDGCPEGESPDQMGARADRVIRRVRSIEGNTLLFSSGHVLRVFAARWLGLDPGAGRYFLLGTASLSVVGYEHDRSEPAIRLWDEMPREQRISPAPAGGYQEKARQ